MSYPASNGTENESHAETPGEENTTSVDKSNANGTEDSKLYAVGVVASHDSSPSNSTKYESSCKPNDFLLQTLDALELRVEKMRETARSIEDEKTTLLDSLNTMMQSEAIDQLSEAEREELGLYIDRLITRCLTIDISIQTIRTPAQEQSLHKVKALLRDLIDTLREDIERSRQRLQLYLNSCLDCTDSGPIDERFQGAILGCAAEDQKQIKKKLKEIWDSWNQSEEFLAMLRTMSLDL